VAHSEQHQRVAVHRKRSPVEDLNGTPKVEVYDERERENWAGRVAYTGADGEGEEDHDLDRGRRPIHFSQVAVHHY